MKSLLIIALLAPALAFATSSKPTPGTVPPINNKAVNINKPVNINAPSNTNSNTNSSNAASSVTNSVNANPTASASSGAAASNQGVSTTVNNNTPDSLKTVGQAPDVFAPATAPCRVGIGGSIGVMGGAFGIGGSVRDDDCVIMELSRRFEARGNAKAADQVLCLIPEAKQALEATGVKCLISKPEAVQQEKVTP